MGAGSIRADRAVNPTLVFNETYADFVAAGTDTIHRVDLNLPSVDATTMPGTLSTQRTAINVSGQNQNMAVQITAPAGVSITVGNNNHDLHVNKGDSVTFPITISAPTVANGQYFGSIRLTPSKGGNPVYMPVAFVKTQGAVTLSSSCSPTSFAANTGSTHCTSTVQNLGQTAANAALNVTQGDHPEDGVLRYTNVGAPGTVPPNAKSVQWSGSLSPAIPPQVTAINNITGSGPAGGYLPLSLFGGNLVVPGADDAITNVNVPAFSYGGESYNRIGVVTDGYIVIGGGTSADVNFFPQTFPNTAKPNNVIAPFWTDLNTTGGTIGNNAILVNVLGDGVSNWLVVDFESVKNFSNATRHSGEIWIKLGGPANEQLTISYGTANAAAGDPGSAMNWGAENRDGTSGKNIPSAPANNTEYRPVLSGPTAGGSVSIPYDATAAIPGGYTSVASMTSDKTPGITQVVSGLTVTP
jgi:hypothetical protein